MSAATLVTFFCLAAVDSAGFPALGGPDGLALLVGYQTRDQSAPFMSILQAALVGAIGSTLGSLVLYKLAHSMAPWFVKKLGISETAFRKFKGFVSRREFIAVVSVSGVLCLTSIPVHSCCDASSHAQEALHCGRWRCWY